MKFLMILVLSLICVSSFADDPQCTQEPREKWLKTDLVKAHVKKMGINLKMFKTMEYCYLAQGLDKAGKPVEIYFNPATGKVFPLK